MLYSAKDLGYLSDEDFSNFFDLTVRIEQALLRFIQVLEPNS